MRSIGAKIRSRTSLTTEEIEFINQSAQPVWEITRNGVVRGSLDQAIDAYEYPIASSLAFRIFDDLLTNMDFLMGKALSDATTLGIDSASASNSPCNLAIYEPARAKLERLMQDVVEARKASFQAYRVVISEQHSISAQTALFKADRDDTSNLFILSQSER